MVSQPCTSQFPGRVPSPTAGPLRHIEQCTKRELQVTSSCADVDAPACRSHPPQAPPGLSLSTQPPSPSLRPTDRPPQPSGPLPLLRQCSILPAVDFLQPACRNKSSACSQNKRLRFSSHTTEFLRPLLPRHKGQGSATNNTEQPTTQGPSC